MFKKNTALIIFLLTLLLGGVAVFTAARLQKTEEPIPPQPTKAAGPAICGGRGQIESCDCTGTSSNNCPTEVQALCESLSTANDNYPVTCFKCNNCGEGPVSSLDAGGDSIFWHCIESGNASFDSQPSSDCCSGPLQGRLWLDNDGNGLRQSNQEPFITNDPAVTVQVGTTPIGGDYKWKRATTYSDSCAQNAPYQTQYPSGDDLYLRVQLPEGWTVTGARVNPDLATCQGGDTLQSRGMRGLCWRGSIEDENCNIFVVQDFHVSCGEGKEIWIGIKEGNEPPPENEPPTCESLIRTPAGSVKIDDVVTFECGGSDPDGTVDEIAFKIVHSDWEIVKTCRRAGSTESSDCPITDLGEGKFSAQITYTIPETGTYEVYSKVCDDVGVCTEFTK